MSYPLHISGTGSRTAKLTSRRLPSRWVRCWAEPKPGSAVLRLTVGLPEPPSPVAFENQGENAFAAAVRKLLPSGVADKCRIQVIVQMAGDEAAKEEPASPNPNSVSENEAECRSD